MFFHTYIACLRVVIFSTIIIFLLLSTLQAYNLNVKRAEVFSRPNQFKQNRPSYFGFTVALYNSPNFEDQSVLVGAPRANTTQTLVNEPGTVYKCTSSSNCTEWSLDNTYGENFRNGHVSRDKSWLGASISVEDTDNPRIVVCSPRWKIRWGKTTYMDGICYHAQVDANRSFYENPIERIMPLTFRHLQTATDSNGVGYHKYGMALLGFSLNTFSNQGGWYGLLGAPGAHNAHGEPILLYQNASQIDRFAKEDFDTTHHYLGYSITSGNYLGIEDIQYAVGAPRTADMRGEVLVYVDDPFKKLRLLIDILDGPQIGEYFGASLTSCDIDNNGKDEIIVGAPMWTNRGDEGNVYIFSMNNNKFSLSTEIHGNVEDARFGSSVMCLGDVDRDGYEDFAVGAPYENGHGAIYIYNGNHNGLPLTWSQRISGDEFPQGLRGFGISISQPRDIDGNGYFDVAVGAHQSGHAIVLRCQPVVRVNLKIRSSRMNFKNDAISFPIQICCTYEGKSAPNSLNTIIRMEIDTAHERAYMTGLRRESRTYILPSTLFLRDRNCQNLTVSLKERNANVIDPIKISASLILDPVLNSSPEFTKDFYRNSPILNKYMSKDKDNITLEFALDCGMDNICDSNITLGIKTNLGIESSYVIGSPDSIKLFVDIHNYGEAAYQLLAHVFIPESMALLNKPVDCTHNGDQKIHEIICPMENPLVFKANFTLELVVKQTRSIEKHVKILAYVTTQSNNLNPNESKKNVTIHFMEDIDITLSGNAHEPSYFTLDTENKHMLESIKFQHIYGVLKFGVTPIVQSHLTVSIPTHIVDHEKKVEIEVVQIIPKGISLHETADGQNSQCVQEYNNTAHEKTKYFRVNETRGNDTFYMDCNNPVIMCTTISCTFETSSNSLMIGGVTITMELKMNNLTNNVMNKTSTISFISNGRIRIISPTGIIQSPGNRPDYIEVETLFDSSTTMASQLIPFWIILLSVFLGIVLLALVTYGLIKFGFFNRKQKEELEALKSDETKRHTISLETLSSTEILDQE